MTNAKSPSLSALRKCAWDMLSKYIRLSHADHRGFCACYTCGAQQHWKEIHAGHAIDGRRNAVLLDEEIVKPQCYRCNVLLDGNHRVFARKLVKVHGSEWWEHKRHTSRQPKKYHHAELEQLIHSYRTRIAIVEPSRNPLSLGNAARVVTRHAFSVSQPKPKT